MDIPSLSLALSTSLLGKQSRCMESWCEIRRTFVQWQQDFFLTMCSQKEGLHGSVTQLVFRFSGCSDVVYLIWYGPN